MTTTAAVALTTLAQRFDDLAAVLQGRNQRRAMRNAAQLRTVAQLSVTNRVSVDEAWAWADAGAGQLINDKQQLDKKGKR